MERPLGYSWYLWLSREFAVPAKHQLQGCRPTLRSSRPPSAAAERDRWAAQFVKQGEPL
jgi:hypothetical protein